MQLKDATSLKHASQVLKETLDQEEMNELLMKDNILQNIIIKRNKRQFYGIYSSPKPDFFGKNWNFKDKKAKKFPNS